MKNGISNELKKKYLKGHRTEFINWIEIAIHHQS